MKINLLSPNKNASKCLVLVGGHGDTVEVLSPLAHSISALLLDHQVCTFDFSTDHTESESVLDIQARELEQVFGQLSDLFGHKSISIWCTSQGAYATTKLLVQNNFVAYISKVVMYDPADYYLSSRGIGSWTGFETYLPTARVVSDELVRLSGDYKVNVVHLPLRNHGPNGYLESEYLDRGKDDAHGYPRLNTQMVKSFYSKLPASNQGKYLEDSLVPHGFVRDGDLQKNLKRVATIAVQLISS